MMTTFSSATRAGAFGAVFAALYAAHQVGDHWIQTDHQAQNKGTAGVRGWRANLAHVAGYTATTAAAVATLNARYRLGLRPSRVAAGLAVNAVTHSWADRRHTLAGLAERTGHGPFYRLGTPRAGHDDNPSLGTGPYALDQAWHVGWLFVSALVIA